MGVGLSFAQGYKSNSASEYSLLRKCVALAFRAGGKLRYQVSSYAARDGSLHFPSGDDVLGLIPRFGQFTS